MSVPAASFFNGDYLTKMSHNFILIKKKFIIKAQHIQQTQNNIPLLYYSCKLVAPKGLWEQRTKLESAATRNNVSRAFLVS